MTQWYEGWAVPDRSRVAHYIRFTASLCGKHTYARPATSLAIRTPATSERCRQCEKLRVKLVTRDILQPEASP